LTLPRSKALEASHVRGYEHPDPAKAKQFKRWRELTKVRDENEKKTVRIRIGFVLADRSSVGERPL